MDVRGGFPRVGVLIALLSAGCEPSTTMSSNRAAAYSAHPQMLFVATAFEPTRGVDTLFNSFQTSFESAL
jgi:hypothetical protein